MHEDHKGGGRGDRKESQHSRGGARYTTGSRIGQSVQTPTPTTQTTLQTTRTTINLDQSMLMLHSLDLLASHQQIMDHQTLPLVVLASPSLPLQRQMLPEFKFHRRLDQHYHPQTLLDSSFTSWY